MRLVLYYIIQIAFVIAGFTGVSVAFVTINSGAMSKVVNQLVSEAAVVAVHQVLEPLEKFSVQVKVFANTLTSMPQLLANDPSQPQWNESPAVALDTNYLPPLNVTIDAATRIKLAMLLNNPLAMYAYESFEMPDNKTQWSDCVVARGTNGPRSYWTVRPSLRRHPVDPINVLCQFNVTDPGNGQLTASLIDQDYQCAHSDASSTGNPWQIEARALTVADGATGRWTSFYMFFPPEGTPVPLLTFGVPTRFSDTVDPTLGRVYTTSAAQMDLNALFFTDALMTAKSSLDTIDLALYWDLDDTIIAWTLPSPPINAVDQTVLKAGASGSIFDDALRLFATAGWCNQSVGSALLSRCTPPADAASMVSDSSHLFALRRVTHVNAKFSIIISGSRAAFFGPGEQARAVGIGVGVATCVIAVAACCVLWLAIAVPLSRLIDKMQTAARFEELDDGEARANESAAAVTEIGEADDAFRDMHAQLLAAKPFMPRHLLIALGRDTASDESEHELAVSQPARGRGEDRNSSQADLKSHAQSTTRSERSSRRSAASIPLTATAMLCNTVAVLVCNVTNFAQLSSQCTQSQLQSRYAELIDVIVSSVTSQRGVIDAVQGDHVVVTFNSATRCAGVCARAVHAAFNIKEALSKRGSLPEEWREMTFGVAPSKALCGPMGSATLKSHATLGGAMRAAVALQRLARAWPPCADGSPQWCVATGAVAAECATFAHYRHVTVAKLPSSQSVVVVTALCPPAPAAASVTPPPGASVDTMGDGEWLYEVQAIATSNPWATANAEFASTFGVDGGGALRRDFSASQFLVDVEQCQQVLAVCGMTPLMRGHQ